MATSAPLIDLRAYQRDAVNAVESDWAAGISRLGVAMPTGSGKTPILATLASNAYHRGQRVVMLAHRAELIEQMTSTVHRVDPSIPAHEVGVVRAAQDDHGAAIVGATLQTLSSSRRLRALGKRQVILWDEVHHAGAEGFHATFSDLGGYDDALMCGLTATMRRNDRGRIGLGDVIQKISFERDLPWAIENGFLVPPRGLTVALDGLNALNDVRTVAGDFAQNELAEVMEAATSFVVDAITLHAGARRPIVFAASVDAAHLIADALNEARYPAVVVTGDQAYEQRKVSYDQFRSGAVRAMVTVMVLTEGADFPMCDSVVLARPTRSSNLYCYDAQTEILTPGGWKLGNTVRRGDRVAEFDPATNEVAWTTVEAHVDRLVEPGEGMVSLASPTVDFRVTGNHRMVWAAGNSGAWSITEAADLAQRRTGFQLPMAGMQKGHGISLTHDEIAFIGWVETDGGFNKHNGVIYISQQDPDNCAEIERVLTGCGFKWRVGEHANPTNFGPRKHPLRIYRVSRGKPRGQDKDLRGWGDLASWIPKVSSEDVYELLDSLDGDQWAVFLNALHRANGAKQLGQSWTRQGYHISTPRKQFADWVQSMCVRREWRANVSTEKRDGQDIHTVHCHNRITRTVGGARQQDRQHMQVNPAVPGERVWCVQVSTGAVIVRRNGKALVCGNSQMIGRSLRLWEDPWTGAGKEDALVLDLTGSARHMRLVNLSQLLPGVQVDVVDAQGNPLVEEAPEPAVAAETPPDKPRRRGAVDMVSIDLMSGTTREAAWLDTLRGIPFISLTDHWIVFLWPQYGIRRDARRWAVGNINTHTHQGGWMGREQRYLSLEEAIEYAELCIPAAGFHLPERSAGWHSANRAPSEKQIMLARSLGIVDYALCTKGRLSDEISIVFASRTIDRFVQDVLAQEATG